MEYLVIGAGPAGLQLAYFLEQAGRDYLVLEAGPGPGTFFTTFPRHRELISSNKRYTGSTDPEFNLRMIQPCDLRITASATFRRLTKWCATWVTSLPRFACALSMTLELPASRVVAASARPMTRATSSRLNA